MKNHVNTPQYVPKPRLKPRNVEEIHRIDHKCTHESPTPFVMKPIRCYYQGWSAYHSKGAQDQSAAGGPSPGLEALQGLPVATFGKK